MQELGNRVTMLRSELIDVKGIFMGGNTILSSDVTQLGNINTRLMVRCVKCIFFPITDIC